VVYSLLLISLMLFRPLGLLGSRELSLRALLTRVRAHTGAR
jgi:hypothetical protein